MKSSEHERKRTTINVDVSGLMEVALEDWKLVWDIYRKEGRKFATSPAS